MPRPRPLRRRARDKYRTEWRTTLADERGFGVLGSSVFVANPQTLFGTLQPVLQWLAQTLKQFDGAKSALERSNGA